MNELDQDVWVDYYEIDDGRIVPADSIEYGTFNELTGEVTVTNDATETTSVEEVSNSEKTKFQNVQYFEHTSHGYFSYNDVIPAYDADADQIKFNNFAYAFVNRDDESFIGVAPQYGNFSTFYRRRNFAGVFLEEIDSRICSQAELGLSKDDTASSKFYKPTFQDSEETVVFYQDKLRCFDEPIQLQGNDKFSSYKQFVISFTYCNPEERDDCRPFHETRNYMSGISVLLLANARTVKDIDITGNPWSQDQSDFQINEQSRVYWAHIDTQGRIEQHFKLRQSEAISYELSKGEDGSNQGRKIVNNLAYLEKSERVSLEIYALENTRPIYTTFEIIIERDLDLKKLYAQHIDRVLPVTGLSSEAEKAESQALIAAGATKAFVSDKCSSLDMGNENCERFYGCVRIFSNLGGIFALLYVFLYIWNYLFSCTLYAQYIKHKRSLLSEEKSEHWCHNCQNRNSSQYGSVEMAQMALNLQRTQDASSQDRQPINTEDHAVQDRSTDFNANKHRTNHAIHNLQVNKDRAGSAGNNSILTAIANKNNNNSFPSVTPDKSLSFQDDTQRMDRYRSEKNSHKSKNTNKNTHVIERHYRHTKEIQNGPPNTSSGGYFGPGDKRNKTPGGNPSSFEGNKGKTRVAGDNMIAQAIMKYTVNPDNSSSQQQRGQNGTKVSTSISQENQFRNTTTTKTINVQNVESRNYSHNQKDFTPRGKDNMITNAILTMPYQVDDNRDTFSNRGGAGGPPKKKIKYSGISTTNMIAKAMLNYRLQADRDAEREALEAEAYGRNAVGVNDVQLQFDRSLNFNEQSSIHNLQYGNNPINGQSESEDDQLSDEDDVYRVNPAPQNILNHSNNSKFSANLL